jgi:Sodium:neurotransmitter symporter family
MPDQLSSINSPQSLPPSRAIVVAADRRGKIVEQITNPPAFLIPGVGLASVIVSFLMSSYYSVIIAYSIYFFFTSFRSDLPWSGCSNPRWVSFRCVKVIAGITNFFTDNARLLEFRKVATESDPS